MVGPVHEEDPTPGKTGIAELELVAAGTVDQSLRIVGDLAPIGVRAVQVLGAHPGAVRRLPPERRPVDRGGHAPPHDRVLDPGQPQDLGHLRDVAEHVGEVPHAHRAAELVAPCDAELEVAHDRLSRHHELVHEDHPRPEVEPARGDERGDALGPVGPDLGVVVDDDGLAVEEEPPVRIVVLEEVEQVVDERDQTGPRGLERGIPLAVPVRVGHDADLAWLRLHGLRLRRDWVVR